MLAGALQRLCLPAMANTSTATQASVIDEARTDLDIARVALLLPLHSTLHSSAAQAVQAGMMAAHDYDGLYLSTTVIATGDSVQDIVRAYRTASQHYDMIIGPLSRDAVQAVVQQAAISKPTIALAYPDGVQSPADARSSVLMTGMAVEEEARQIAYWMQEHDGGGVACVVYSTVTWQQRAAQAWLVQAKKLGLRAIGVQIPLSGDLLQHQALQELQRRLAHETTVQFFVAVSVAQAQQVRSVLGLESIIYGTSHLNPFMIDRNYGQAYPWLEGARLLDIPWQLPASGDVSGRYPHPQGYFGARPTVTQRRLYALGIDAYRIAQEVAQGRRGFELDGVTGQLTVAMHAGGVTYFQRQYRRAQFLHGSVVALQGQYS